MFLDTKKQIEKLKKNFLKKEENDFILEAAVVNDYQKLQRNHFERSIISELKKCKVEAVKFTTNLLNIIGLFVSFKN